MTRAVRSWLWNLAVVAGGVGIAAGASAAVWPGGAPCNGTLQACIDGVASGGVVELSNAVADESLLIDKSLTLRPVFGKLGVIGGGTVTRSIQVKAGSGGAVSVRIENLTLDNAVVDVGLSSGAGHQVTIRGCSIRNEAVSNNTRGIDVDVRVPSTVTAEYNDIETNGNGIALFTLLSSGAASFAVRGNRVTGLIPELSSDGIQLDLRGSGTVAAEIHSNLIHGVATCHCGGATGLPVSLSDTIAGSIEIINNTIDDLESDGIYVSVAATASGAVQVFNNIVTGATVPVQFPPFAATLLISSGFNDFFNDTSAPNYGGYPPGAGVISVDPSYVSAVTGDYHLQETSDVVDAGTAVPPGGLPAFDADGKPRQIGPLPDLGAFEVPEPAATASAAAAGVVLAALARRRAALRVC